MKHCYKCKTFKLPTEFGKNKSRKDGLSDECRVCKKQQDREYAAKNREAAKERASKWYYDNLKYALEQRRIIGKKWRAENKDKNAVKSNRRRANKLKATPNWLTAEQHQQIEAFYWLAKLQCELTDTKYHVDHIVPLKGKTVCGLHVPWNLQVITALDNIRKGNKIVL
jgi:hypothetical protein